MGLLSRLGRVIKANISSFFQEAEDPEKILEQVILDMQQNLISLRQGVAQAIANQKRVERQMTQNQVASEQWHRRAQLALEKGDEELAREALLRRQPYQATAKALQNQIEQQREIIEKLKRDMRTLETKIIEAKTKKDMYIARARSAVATQKIQQLAEDLKTGNSSNAFAKMEEKLFELEAHSELLNVANNKDYLEQRFADLEKGNYSQLSPTSSNLEAHTPVIDDELEHLRSELDDL